MTETGSKLVFSIFARNKSAVSRDLGSWVFWHLGIEKFSSE
jgi:hypothetical protein